MKVEEAKAEVAATTAAVVAVSTEVETAEVELPTGERATLKTIKGTPPTMDCAALLRTLRSLRDDTDGTQQLPYYDRQAHDPRPNGAIVGPETAVILVEGIHLLHAEGEWAELRQRRRRLVVVHASGQGDDTSGLSQIGTFFIRITFSLTRFARIITNYSLRLECTCFWKQ